MPGHTSILLNVFWTVRSQLEPLQYFITQRILIQQPIGEITVHFDWETFTYDEAWLREAVRIEEEFGGDISAGPDWGTHLGTVMANPQGQSHFAQLRSMVMQAWKQLVTEWDLGVGAAAAAAKGQELILKRLHQSEPEIQETLLALLEDKLSKPQGEWEMTQTVHEEIRAVFRKVLTPENWKAIAQCLSCDLPPTDHFNLLQVLLRSANVASMAIPLTEVFDGRVNGAGVSGQQRRNPVFKNG